MDHNSIGHNSIGHDYIGHDYIGHNYGGQGIDFSDDRRGWNRPEDKPSCKAKTKDRKPVAYGLWPVPYGGMACALWLVVCACMAYDLCLYGLWSVL